MTDMILETQSLARMLLNFLGPLPEQINTMNMIYTLYYNPADWFYGEFIARRTGANAYTLYRA